MGYETLLSLGISSRAICDRIQWDLEFSSLNIIVVQWRNSSTIISKTQNEISHYLDLYGQETNCTEISLKLSLIFLIPLMSSYYDLFSLYSPDSSPDFVRFFDCSISKLIWFHHLESYWLPLYFCMQDHRSPFCWIVVGHFLWFLKSSYRCKIWLSMEIHTSNPKKYVTLK